MKNINPLYILVFILLITIYLSFQKSSLRSKLVTIADEKVILEHKIKEINKLKNDYANVSKNKDLLLRTINDSTFEEYAKLKQIKERSVKIEFKGMDKDLSKQLLQKILNTNSEVLYER
jgi:hypothetical protein